MINSRERSTIRPGMLMNEKRIAFIRLGAQDFPKATCFMMLLRFIANIMIHHHAAFSPNHPMATCRRLNLPSSPSAPPPTSRNAPGASESIFPLPNPCSSPIQKAVSYTHLRAHETRHDLVCRLLLEKKKTK